MKTYSNYLRRVTLLFIVPGYLLSALPARAQDSVPAADTTEMAKDIRETKNALDILKQLPVSVQKVQEVVNAAYFGPFLISGSCKYNGVWYCLGTHCTTFYWSWPFPQYTTLKDELNYRFQNIRNAASRFENRFSPLKSWMLTTLPAISRQLDTASARIKTAQATIRNPDILPIEIETAKQEILQEIVQITASLTQGYEQLTAAVSGLSAFNQQLNSSLQTLERVRIDMEQLINADEQRVNQTIGGWPCGVDDARNKYNGIKITVQCQFQNVITAAQSFRLCSEQTDLSVSIILGRVLNIMNSSQNVLKNIKTAQITPAGALQQLHWNIAEAAWRDLSAYARRQFAQ